MDALTIHEAAETTGWSPRMLRYIERFGLVEAPRSGSGYRLYGAAQLQRLRTLRELLAEFEIGLGDVGFALRLRRDDDLRGAVEAWFEAEEVAETVTSAGPSAHAGPEVHLAPPWEGYDEMALDEVLARLADADETTLAAVRLYESRGESRQAILLATDTP